MLAGQEVRLLHFEREPQRSQSSHDLSRNGLLVPNKLLLGIPGGKLPLRREWKITREGDAAATTS
jgi:hypothetical protein